MPRTARRSFRHRISGKRGTPLAKRPGAHPLNASLYSLVSFSILVPRAARRSFELKDQASAARRTLQRMRPRAPPHDCSVVCFCIQCGRAADRAENFPKKGKRARCTRQLMRSRAPALKTVSHISGSPATAVPRFGRRRFLNNSSIERGARDWRARGRRACKLVTLIFDRHHTRKQRVAAALAVAHVRLVSARDLL